MTYTAQRNNYATHRST